MESPAATESGREPAVPGSLVTRGGLVAGALAPILFVVTVLGAGGLQPGFSQVRSFVSELGVTGSATAVLVNPAFVVTGLLLGWFALALHASAGRDRHGPVAVFGGRVARLFGAVGLGFVVMAAWTCSVGCPIAIVDSAATPSDALHNAAAIAAIASLSTAALTVGAELSPGAPGVPSWYRRYSTFSGSALGALSALFFVAVLVANRPAIGISERALLLAGLAWVEVTAVVARRVSRTPGNPAP
jgi:hypothetical membrane protein